MRVGKVPTRDSGSSTGGESVKRRQSLTSAVTAFAAEFRARQKKSSLSRLASAVKSTDELSLPNPARSKSCSHLPITASTSTSDEPLLTLVLASTSFLDTTISESGERLYVIDTKGTRTNISREDPIQGIAHVGLINWVDEHAEDKSLLSSRHPATIQMIHAQRYNVEDFLRRTKLTSSRMFDIPHYPHALKWKRMGGSYKLTMPKVKTTVAILEPAVHPTPARIKVFDSSYEHDTTHPLREYRGVPVILLDYLITTALLVTAEKDGWLAETNGTIASGSGYSAPYGPGMHGTVQRWRMGVRPSPVDEKESRSGLSTPEAASPSVFASSTSNSNSNNSNVEAASDPGVVDIGLARRTSSPRSQSHLRPPERTNSQLRVSTASLELTTMDVPERSPGLSIPIASHHPFASEPSAIDDDSSSLFSPLTSILPPTLGVSQSLGGETSPLASPRWSSRPESPDSLRTRDGNSSRYSHARVLSAESLERAETPRLAIISLPASPTMATTLNRPAMSQSSGGRRPYRPLPVLPAPKSPGRVSEGSSDSAAGLRVSRGVSLSLASASRRSGALDNLQGIATVVSRANNDGPRALRRTTSETTLSGKLDSSALPNEPPKLTDRRREEGQRENDLGRDLRRDSLILKGLHHRNSIYKEPFPVPSSPSTTAAATPPPPSMSSRTTSESDVSRLSIPPTAPLRIRQPRPVPAASALVYDTIQRASTSSSSYSHSRSMTRHQRQTRLPQGEEDESECGAPPAYDSIDFSRPPLTSTGSLFRGGG